MSILSLNFVGFALAVVIVYYIIPLKFRWLVLLAASCVFYALAGWQGCIWLLAVAIITFLSSLLQEKLLKREKEVSDIEYAISKAEEDKAAAEARAAAMAADAENAEASGAVAAESVDMAEADASEAAEETVIPSLPAGWASSSRKIKRYRKLLLAVSIIILLGAMAYSKYFNFIVSLFREGDGLAILMPLGLSYFTFQTVGYMIDVYRGKFPAARNPLKYLLFVSFFPQMTQGPISPYNQLMPQLEEGHRFNPDNFVMGVQLALWGIFKKIVIADRLSTVTNSISTDQRGWMIFLTVVIYAIRLYTDFSGGMDVIRGVARMLGIDMVENFRRPFFSLSVAEYWRRWHISLGNWFRNYLYYPLSTSEFGLKLSKIGRTIFGKKAGRGLPATVANIIIFFLIGIWHTASANAVLFGLYFGLMLGIEVLLDPAFRKWKKKWKINDKSTWWKAYNMIRTWILILIPQYFAFIATPQESFSLMRGTFMNWSFQDMGVQFTDIMTALQWYIVAAACVILLIVDIICEKKPDLNEKIAKGHIYIRWPIIILLILIIVIFGCYGTGYDATAFLYTNF